MHLTRCPRATLRKFLRRSGIQSIEHRSHGEFAKTLFRSLVAYVHVRDQGKPSGGCTVVRCTRPSARACASVDYAQLRGLVKLRLGGRGSVSWWGSNLCTGRRSEGGDERFRQRGDGRANRVGLYDDRSDFRSAITASRWNDKDATLW